MELRELQIEVPAEVLRTPEVFLAALGRGCSSAIGAGRRSIRFLVSETNQSVCRAEVGVIEAPESELAKVPDIFQFKKRNFENTDSFNVVLIIPTGIGAEIGGHSGDGNAVARLMASACDLLVTHPNVLNAADINEMTENTLYVEGSFITRLMMGQIGLRRVRSNRLLLLMDRHEDGYFNEAIVNAVSSARVTLGLDCDVAFLEKSVECRANFSSSGRASAEILRMENLFSRIGELGDYDGYALASRIHTPPGTHEHYFSPGSEMVNPWGGAEALLTHAVALRLNRPVAHSPISASRSIRDFEYGYVDPRKAPEALSITYLHCILKGMHRHPRITDFSDGLNAENISALVVPNGCLGLPTVAALAQGIPVIVVRENRNLMMNDLESLFASHRKIYFVENYVEAAGVCALLKSGVELSTVRRPIPRTLIK